MKTLAERIEELPAELRRKVEDFAQFLMEKRVHREGGVLRQTWAAALRDFREQYTSHTLQKKAAEWRGD